MALEGTFGNVSVAAGDAASVHVAGLQERATLSLTGLSDVAVIAKTAGQRHTHPFLSTMPSLYLVLLHLDGSACLLFGLVWRVGV